MELSLFGLPLMIEFNAFDCQEIDDLLPFTSLIPSFLFVNGFRCEISVGLSSAGLAWYVLLLRLFVNLLACYCLYEIKRFLFLCSTMNMRLYGLKILTYWMANNFNKPVMPKNYEIFL